MTIFKRVLAVLLSGLWALAVSGSPWRAADPAYQWSFPQDHWAHPAYKIEWWYFTGHLEAGDDPARLFGYQFTFFRIGLSRQPLELDSRWAAASLIMGHAAVSDLSSQTHLFSEVLYRAAPFLGGFASHPDPLLAWSHGPAGTAEEWKLAWNGKAFDFQMQDRAQRMGFQLSTRPLKPLVFQGPNGYSRKGEDPGAASQYYSFTRLETEGTLFLGGQTFQVSGESWMDREFGSNQLKEDQAGWDWFSLQTADGREIMLYLLRHRSGATDFASGTIIEKEARVRYLNPRDWNIEVTSHWTSPHTGARYPAAWVVSLPAEDLRMKIIPELADQEDRSRLLPHLYYWEGAVEISSEDGKKLGQGYVELTGYGKDARPPL